VYDKSDGPPPEIDFDVEIYGGNIRLIFPERFSDDDKVIGVETLPCTSENNV
jgi:hypothetical protein